MMMSVEQLFEWELAVEIEVLGENSSPVPLHSPKIPHNLIWLDPGGPLWWKTSN
jgi:hypothetical protein